jgi:hypothetical protein
MDRGEPLKREVAQAVMHRHMADGSLVLSMQVMPALDSGCDVLHSEDVQAGRRYGALDVVNPFLPGAHEPPPPNARRSTRRAVAQRS